MSEKYTGSSCGGAGWLALLLLGHRFPSNMLPRRASPSSPPRSQSHHRTIFQTSSIAEFLPQSRRGTEKILQGTEKAEGGKGKAECGIFYSKRRKPQVDLFNRREWAGGKWIAERTTVH